MVVLFVVKVSNDEESEMEEEQIDRPPDASRSVSFDSSLPSSHTVRIADKLDICDFISKIGTLLRNKQCRPSYFHTFAIVFLINIAQGPTKMFSLDAHERQISYALTIMRGD